MSHIIIGTAGHIDHGKTALVRALTGYDTDRLAEEKRRGITIELGFAQMPLPDGHIAGIIDVPGHERFIRNMAAGAWGMDLVLLVIAADEGVMPQTREHMWILDLLGVKNYMIVLNKCDLADREWLDFAEEEVRKELEGTALGGASLFRVSARTGEGVSRLKAAIAEQAAQILKQKEEEQKKNPAGPARLPVDRVFTVPGTGVVVTGTAAGGKLEKQEILQVYPGQKLCRIRQIQTYNRDTDTCSAGQRSALNVTGEGIENLHRGNVLAGKDSLDPSRFFHVKLTLLKESGRKILNRSRLHFYSGTAEVMCRAVLLDRDVLDPGESSFARLEMENPMALCMGDRFVVRFYSPLETIGGGIILETDVFREKRFQPGILERLEQRVSNGLSGRAEYLLSRYSRLPMEPKMLARKLGIGETEVWNLCRELEAQGKAVVFEDGDEGSFSVWHAAREKKFRETIRQCLKEYEADRIYAPGMPEVELAARTMGGLRKRFASRYMKKLEEEGSVCREDGYVMLPWYRPEQTGVYSRLQEALQAEADRKGSVLFRFCAEEWGRSLGFREADVRDCLFRLEKEEMFIRLEPELYGSGSRIREAEQKAAQILETLGEITIAQVRDLLDTGRKQAKLFLDYTDRKGSTKKEGAESVRVKNQ